MDKYLLEILKSVNTIIIPGLGALTITDHDTGEIMFMPYLKHDDGKLIQYIVENEGFEELDAKNLIAKYVREIQLTLDKGESYDMFQFGSFVKNGDEIDFKNWEGSSSKLEAPEKKEAAITEEPEEKIPVVTEEKEVHIENDEEEKPDKKVKTPVIEEKVEKPSVDKVEPIIVQLKDDIEEPKKELNILEKEERAATADKLKKLKADKERPKAKNKKGAAFWMLMTLIALIIVGGTYFGLNYDQLKQHVPFLAEKEVISTTTSPVLNNTKTETPIVNSESDEQEDSENTTESEVEEKANEDEQVEPVQVEEKITVTPPTSTGSDLPFHIIAGAFSSEDNANRLGEKFRDEGYNVKVGAGRGMTLVSIKSFSTREEAQKGLSELKSVAPNGWIYEWK